MNRAASVALNKLRDPERASKLWDMQRLLTLSASQLQVCARAHTCFCPRAGGVSHQGMREPPPPAPNSHAAAGPESRTQRAALLARANPQVRVGKTADENEQLRARLAKLNGELQEQGQLRAAKEQEMYVKVGGASGGARRGGAVHAGRAFMRSLVGCVRARAQACGHAGFQGRAHAEQRAGSMHTRRRPAAEPRRLASGPAPPQFAELLSRQTQHARRLSERIEYLEDQLEEARRIKVGVAPAISTLQSIRHSGGTADGTPDAPSCAVCAAVWCV